MVTILITNGKIVLLTQIISVGERFSVEKHSVLPGYQSRFYMQASELILNSLSTHYPRSGALMAVLLGHDRLIRSYLYPRLEG